MKGSLKLITLLIASAISTAALADGMQNHQWQRQPFPVVQQRILQKMEMSEKALPSRIQCVKAAANFKELHACFPNHRRWHHKMQQNNQVG